MQIIPVIDIKAGQAVLAKQGDRQNYQPLSTPLCSSCQIDDVINAYLNLYSFTQIYLADLDALMGTGNNQSLINTLVKRYPELNFIVDSGTLNTLFTQKNLQEIIGTESVDRHKLKKTKQHTNNFILSLDFCAQNKAMGDYLIHESPELWPKQIIIMSLGLVGKNNGPDLIRLQHYVRTYSDHNFLAAGGVRHKQDLVKLNKLGIMQALVASALHHGSLTAIDLEQLFIT